jgi:hypothetical protein
MSAILSNVPGKSIRLFLVDGTPGGLLTAEIPNWTGHVLAGPRSRLADVLKRSESRRPGLYLLLGQHSETGEPLAYIGESESLDERLAQHARPEEQRGKDFWDRVVLITSKDANLTKGHLRFVESRLITLALTAKRMALDNTKGTINEYGLLPEADQADMLYFIEQLRLLLPMLGVDLLRETAGAPVPGISGVATTKPLTGSAPPGPVRFELSAPKAGVRAEAVELDGEFVVQAGAVARADWSESQLGFGYQKLHAQLMSQGVLSAEGAPPGMLRFTAPYAFNSPSAASAVLLARSDNGRKSWRVAGSNMSYAEWQSQQVEASMVQQLGELPIVGE